MGYFAYPQGSNSGDHRNDDDWSHPNHYIMEDFTSGEWKTFFDYAQSFDFKKNQIIVHYGRKERSIYIVLAGEVIILKNHPLFGQRMVASVQEGQIFGEATFFDYTTPPVIVKAVTAGRCLKMSYENYFNMLNHNAGIANKFIINIARILLIRNRYSNHLFHKIFHI